MGGAGGAVGHEDASSPADLAKFTAIAVTVQVLQLKIPGIREVSLFLPDLDQRLVPDIAFHKSCRLQGKATLDVSLGLNADVQTAGGTPAPEVQTLPVGGVAQFGFMGGKVTDVVTHADGDAPAIFGGHDEIGNLRQVLGLNQKFGVALHPAHG